MHFGARGDPEPGEVEEWAPVGHLSNPEGSIFSAHCGAFLVRQEPGGLPSVPASDSPLGWCNACLGCGFNLQLGSPPEQAPSILGPSSLPWLV